MSSPDPTNHKQNMNSLLSMGFSQELASQALAATLSSSNSSIEAATDWILTHTHTSQISQSPHSSQSNLRHFIFSKSPQSAKPYPSPLPDRMRPSTIDLILGQDHLLPLLRCASGGNFPSLLPQSVRFASEDVGLADSAALGHAVACYQACHFIGMPECDVCLAQCVVYLALAPKSVDVYKALSAAKRAVKESAGGNEGVPLHLRNAPTKLMKEMGYGEGYLYPPDHPQLCEGQSYLPDSLKGRKFLQMDVKRP